MMQNDVKPICLQYYASLISVQMYIFDLYSSKHCLVITIDFRKIESQRNAIFVILLTKITTETSNLILKL